MSRARGETILKYVFEKITQYFFKRIIFFNLYFQLDKKKKKRTSSVTSKTFVHSRYTSYYYCCINYLRNDLGTIVSTA